MIMPAIPLPIIQPILNPVQPFLRRLVHLTLVHPGHEHLHRLIFQRRSMAQHHIHLPPQLIQPALHISLNLIRRLLIRPPPVPIHKPDHLINTVGPAHDNGLLPVQIKHFPVLRKQQARILFFPVHHTAMPHLLLISLNGLRPLLMVPMNRKYRNRQGFQKLLLPHIPDSPAIINPGIPKNNHHIFLTGPEPPAESLNPSKLPMGIPCYVNHAIIPSGCPPSGRHPNYTISSTHFTQNLFIYVPKFPDHLQPVLPHHLGALNQSEYYPPCEPPVSHLRAAWKFPP